MRRISRLDLPVPAPPVKKMLSPFNAAANTDSCSSVSVHATTASSSVDGRLRRFLRPDEGDALCCNRMVGDEIFNRGCFRRLGGVIEALPLNAIFFGVAIFRCFLIGVFCILRPPEGGLALLTWSSLFRGFDGVRETMVDSIDLFLGSFSLFPDSTTIGTAERAASKKRCILSSVVSDINRILKNSGTLILSFPSCLNLSLICNFCVTYMSPLLLFGFAFTLIVYSDPVWPT